MRKLNDGLTHEQRDFVREYLINLNGTEAAVRTGYQRDGARKAASDLLRVPVVTDAITDALVKRATRQLSLSQILKDMATRAVPFRRGAAKVGQVIAARNGYAITRIGRPGDPGSTGATRPSDDVFRVFHHGRCFYCPPDSPVSQHILRGHDWDPHLKSVLRQSCAKRKKGVVVEVGANVGATFLSECSSFPEFQFMLIEPLPVFFEILKSNVESFGASNVTLHNVAISDGQSSDILIIYDDVSGGVAAAGSFLGYQQTAVVPSISLDELLPTENITLLKADVDGYELDVFRGGRELLRRSKPDVLFEFNPLAIEVRGVSPLELPKFLLELGIGVFNLYSRDGAFIESTTDPQRVWDVFLMLRSPIDYLDVHACAEA